MFELVWTCVFFQPNYVTTGGGSFSGSFKSARHRQNLNLKMHFMLMLSLGISLGKGLLCTIFQTACREMIALFDTSMTKPGSRVKPITGGEAYCEEVGLRLLSISQAFGAVLLCDVHLVSLILHWISIHANTLLDLGLSEPHH